MRKYALIIGLASFCALLTVSSCKKYEEGPYLSFKSREDRISNTWKVEKFYKNGEELTVSINQDLSSLNWTFSTNGEVSRSITINNQPITVSGQWLLQSDDEEVRIVINTPLYIEDTVWIIVKLMEDEFWVRYSVDGDVYEAHFTPAN
ncbi:MAG: hypothetical protein M0D57_12040 [Sphingobacteriales bacterium JAD_PAG50586_3]|nr:MAG: hypothetical protein M0D57_12040 [Sphingobacteriales bacterium JAD_PAG50586_3]